MKISKPYAYAIKNLFSEIGILRCTYARLAWSKHWKKNTCILIYFANSIDQRNLIYKNSLNLSSKSYFYALASQVQQQKINFIIFSQNWIRPWSSMPVTENCSLLFSSGHLKLVILKDSQFFACYFDISQAKIDKF